MGPPLKDTLSLSRSRPLSGFCASVNVNATNATFSIVLLLQPSALLLPAQIHTLYVTPYETRSMRELAALRMVLGRRRLGWGGWRMAVEILHVLC